MIIQFPKISAIYYGLLQSGYDYYTFERQTEHIQQLQAHRKPELSSAFFSKTKQDTCDVYPYWPRAFIMESASFSLNDSNTDFDNFEAFRRKIMSLGNITDKEREDSLWDWLADFPQALSGVLTENSFSKYLEWEETWIAEQYDIYREQIHMVQKCLEMCTRLYHSPVQKIQICINPIKCVYSSDYHLIGDCFIFSSGKFNAESIIHEFLHHVVHPIVEQLNPLDSDYQFINNQIDKSYIDAGLLNAFEEILVRSLTEDIMNDKYPEDISAYVDSFLTKNRSRL